MNASNAQDKNTHRHRARPVRKAWWVFGGFAAVALVLLGIEHQDHLLGWLPWLFLLACPLMHVFMHRGHGGKDGGGDA